MLRQLLGRMSAKTAAHSAPITPLVDTKGKPIVPAPLRTIQNTNMKTAEYIAVQSLIVSEAGDPDEAKALLGDAGEFLSQLGGPRWPQSADEIYQWCAAKRAGEV